MRWSKPKRERYSSSYNITGRKKNYLAEVSYSEPHDCYYFIVRRANLDINVFAEETFYNSFADKKVYKTEEDCRVACERWIDERTKHYKNE